jgi:antitoxin component YwqK of YwqJK toxin-antitoxin module
MENNIFSGTYGGYLISFENGSDKYIANTKEGIRGWGVRVIVVVENGLWKAFYEDTEREITIKNVYKLICDQE